MTTVLRNDGRELSLVFDSIEEYDADSPAMIAKYNGAMHAEYMGARNPGTYYLGGEHWYGQGCKTAKEAMDKVRMGSPELLAKITAMWGDERPDLLLATSQTKVRRRKRVRADYGDTLDMHKVWSGDLEHAWTRPEREFRLSATQRHATIYVDLAANAMVSAENALWRAATAMLICDILTTAGRAVEIYVGDSTTGGFAWGAGPLITYTAMRVKGYGEPLNEERLAAMVSLTFYRTYAFFMMMAAPFRMTSLGGARNSGMPYQLQERADAGQLVVRIGACFSKLAAIDEFNMVKEALAKQHAVEETV